MGTDERNFRSSYYEKVGCRNVEEKKSLEILLKDKPWDKNKLKQFSLKFIIPATYRNLLWKVQLGVLPVYTDSHTFVTLQRQAQYNDLFHALKVMRIADNNTPKPQLFLAMFLLESGRLYYDFNLQMENGIVPISDMLLQLYDDDVDVYWVAKGFYHFVEQIGKEMPRLIDAMRHYLEKEEPDLYKHIIDKNAMDKLPLEKWFSCLFAGILAEAVLVKIWDKICGGSSMILIFVAIIILRNLKRNLMKCKDAEQISKYILEIIPEAEGAVANSAIEMWQHHFGCNPTNSKWVC